jgi:hypothetical protein
MIKDVDALMKIRRAWHFLLNARRLKSDMVMIFGVSLEVLPTNVRVQDRGTAVGNTSKRIPKIITISLNPGCASLAARTMLALIGG